MPQQRRADALRCRGRRQGRVSRTSPERVILVHRDDEAGPVTDRADAKLVTFAAQIINPERN